MTQYDSDSRGPNEPAVWSFPYRVCIVSPGTTDMYLWCDQNIGKFTRDWNYDLTMPSPEEPVMFEVFMFKSADDAALFKLTWR